jgi:hypothetical protein
LTRFVELEAQKANTVDCAIAEVVNANLVSNQILYIGAPQGVADAAIDMSVHKFGRTTSYTVGQVTSIDTDVKVNYDIGPLTFTGKSSLLARTGHPSAMRAILAL